MAQGSTAPEPGVGAGWTTQGPAQDPRDTARGREGVRGVATYVLWALACALLAWAGWALASFLATAALLVTVVLRVLRVVPTREPRPALQPTAVSTYDRRLSGRTRRRLRVVGRAHRLMARLRPLVGRSRRQRPRGPGMPVPTAGLSHAARPTTRPPTPPPGSPPGLRDAGPREPA